MSNEKEINYVSSDPDLGKSLIDEKAMNKLLQECKDEVARKHGWLHFQELIDDKNFEEGFDIMNEAAQLYAERYARAFAKWMYTDQLYNEYLESLNKEE
jgi:hypothetical protein